MNLAGWCPIRPMGVAGWDQTLDVTLPLVGRARERLKLDAGGGPYRVKSTGTAMDLLVPVGTGGKGAARLTASIAA